MAIATLLPTWFAPSALSGWCSDYPTLPFGLDVGKIVKYAGLNSDQLDLILGENLARLLRIEPRTVRPENHGHRANLTKKSRRLVPRKWVGLSVTRE
jgi:hypothetical protein